MSRNLGDTSCAICSRDVVLCGEPHGITEEEAGGYYNEYKGMIVANAMCLYCDAKYLAWVKRPARWSLSHADERPFVDLSFRHAFNDEPAPEDLPTPTMLQRVHLELCQARIAQLMEKAREAFVEMAKEIEDSLAKPPHWESYRYLR